jgi:hypothetical protein
MAMNPEVRKVLQAAVKKMGDELAKRPDEQLPLFEVNPITNGYLVEYNNVEEYDVRFPVYDPPGAIGVPPPGSPRVIHQGPPPGAPRMETQKRWKIVRASVYCYDADAIKTAVDDALALEEKVKNLIAEGILSSDSIHGDVAVGA